MKLPNIKGLVSVGKAFTMAHRPEILFGSAVVSTVGAVVAAGVGGYKSGQQVLRAEYPDLDLESPEGKIGNELSIKEKAQLTWINYLPATGLTAAALGSTTGLHLVHVKEKKQLAAAALMAIEEVRKEANQYVEDVREAVEENVKLDDKKREKIDEAIIQKNADRNGGVTSGLVDSDGVIQNLYLVRDAKTGRDIYSNEAIIDDAVLRVNELIMSEGSADLDSFYSWAGFNNIPEGGHSGWSGERIGVSWATTVRDDGRPVREFTFRPEPKRGIAELR